MARKIIKTSDNSDTVFDEELNEIFHSTHGAITESKHVFIKNGLEYVSKYLNTLNIFEVGFGTGLNTLLTFIESELKDIYINYYSIELYPLKDEIWKNLNYKNIIDKKYTDIFNLIHESDWDKTIQISSKFTLNKIFKNLQDYDLTLNSDINFDLIYFDAFSPDKQSDLWSKDICLKLYESLNNKGVLVTYCAKGEVKRNLQKSGFIIEKLAGPPGKREMIRARKEVSFDAL